MSVRVQFVCVLWGDSVPGQAKCLLSQTEVKKKKDNQNYIINHILKKNDNYKVRTTAATNVVERRLSGTTLQDHV